MNFLNRLQKPPHDQRKRTARATYAVAVLLGLWISTASSAPSQPVSFPVLPTDPGQLCTGYDLIDGRLAIEGDILLGECLQLKDGSWQFTPRGAFAQATFGVLPQGAAVGPSSWYWPDGVVPYSISSPLSQINDPSVYEDIINAIQHWNTLSVVQIVPRTTESAYVEFVPGGGCSSYIGRTGWSAQPITLVAGGACGFGATVHEIGHALGYWHEQSRQDRDSFVNIVWENIEVGKENNFQKYTSGVDLNAYDYGSIMHYGATAFSNNGGDTIVPDAANLAAWQSIYGPIDIGNRAGLSVLDQLAVDQMYNVCWSGPEAAGGYWQANPWRACAASCTTPGRTREVFCHAADGSCASETLCDAVPKPATTDSCGAMLDCDFDSGSCGWDPADTADTFDWINAFTSTPSSATGPSADHTSGSGFYLYTEASSPRVSGDTAFLTSVPVDVVSGTTLSFWYHYYGTGLGTLEVQVAACGGAWSTLHTISTANTASIDAWRQAAVPLPVTSNAQIRFKMTRGSSYSGDIAIDDISLSVVPRVTLVNSFNDTGDSIVSEAEAVEVSITQLPVAFDQDMADPAGDGGSGDVTNPANYLLYEDGANDTYDTLNCTSGIVADDANIPVNSVSYDAGTRTATLSVNGAIPLGGGSYRLHACGTLVNISGDQLDGDSDGAGGDDFVRSFSVLDFDGDGMPDGEDPDDDNDGVSDVDDAFPLDNSESVDTDGDGTGDNADLDDDNDGLSDIFELDNGLDPLDGTDCPTWICPAGTTSGWRIILLLPQP